MNRFGDSEFWSWLLWHPKFWMTIGFLGQGIFTARFLVQWFASEREKDSVVPVAFWWISLAGGLTLLTYAIYRNDPPIIVGQAMGLFVYVRNLMLIAKRRRREAKRGPRATARGPHLATREASRAGSSAE